MLFFGCENPSKLNKKYVALRIDNVTLVESRLGNYNKVSYNDVVKATAFFPQDENYKEDYFLEYNSNIFNCVENTENTWYLKVITTEYCETKIKLYANDTTSTSLDFVVN